MHFFELEDETVWGATARILTGFLAAPHRRRADHRRLGRVDPRAARPRPARPASAASSLEPVLAAGGTGWKSRSASASPVGGPTGSTTSRSSPAGGHATPRTSTSRGSSTRSASSCRSSASAMDGVVSPRIAIEIGQLGGLGVPQPRRSLDPLRRPRRAVRGDRRAARPRRPRAGCRRSTPSRSRKS